jgi:hypothetical protein
MDHLAGFQSLRVSKSQIIFSSSLKPPRVPNRAFCFMCIALTSMVTRPRWSAAPRSSVTHTPSNLRTSFSLRASCRPTTTQGTVVRGEWVALQLLSGWRCYLHAVISTAHITTPQSTNHHHKYSLHVLGHRG